jgi:hypothetical protein
LSRTFSAGTILFQTYILSEIMLERIMKYRPRGTMDIWLNAAASSAALAGICLGPQLQ